MNVDLSIKQTKQLFYNVFFIAWKQINIYFCRLLCLSGATNRAIEKIHCYYTCHQKQKTALSAHEKKEEKMEQNFFRLVFLVSRVGCSICWLKFCTMPSGEQNSERTCMDKGVPNAHMH
jgi:hypothetical protein